MGVNFRVLVDEKLNVSQKLPDDKKEISSAISHSVYSFFQLDNWSYRTIVDYVYIFFFFPPLIWSAFKHLKSEKK